MKKSLESIVIPTGGRNLEENQKRLETAMRHYFENGQTPYILITGGDSYLPAIYKGARKFGLKPTDFIIEGRSKDTLENFLYSIEKLKERKISSVKIATNLTHYWRFKLFEREGKKKNFIDDSFRIEPAYTSENPRELVYGILAYVKDYIRVKLTDSLGKRQKQRKGNTISFLKNYFLP